MSKSRAQVAAEHFVGKGYVTRRQIHEFFGAITKKSACSVYTAIINSEMYETQQKKLSSGVMAMEISRIHKKTGGRKRDVRLADAHQPANNAQRAWRNWLYGHQYKLDH